MAIKIHSGQTLTLSSTTIDEWLEQRDRILAQMDDLQEQVNGVNAKIHAAFVLMPQLFGSPPADPEKEDSGEQPKTLIESIAEIVRQEGDLAPREIRSRLEAAGTLQEGGSVNYLYTALNRALKRGMISKKGDLYGPPREGEG